MSQSPKFLVALVVTLAFQSAGCGEDIGRITTFADVATSSIQDVACFRDTHIVAVIAEREAQILSFDPLASPIQVVRHPIPGRNAIAITSETSELPSMVTAANGSGNVLFRISVADEWAFHELTEQWDVRVRSQSVPEGLVLIRSKQTAESRSILTGNHMVNGAFVESFRYRYRERQYEPKREIEYYLSSYAVSPDRKRVIECDPGSSKISEFDTESGQLIRRLEFPESAYKRFTGAAFSPDGSHLVVTTINGRVSLWDATTGVFLREIDVIAAAVNHDVRFLNQGKLLFITRPMGEAGRRSAIKFWDGHTFEPIVDIVSMLPREIDDSRTLTAVATSEDGARVVIGDRSGRVHLWNAPADDPRFQRQHSR